MLMEVKRHLREAAEREREGGQAQLVEERDALREQVQMVGYDSLSLSLSITLVPSPYL